MKTIISLYIITALLMSCNTVIKEDIQNTELIYDTISIDNTSIGNVIIGDSLQKVQGEFGLSDSIQKSDNEMDGKIIEKHFYKGLIIYVNNGIVDGFDIISKEYCFSKLNICVGDNITELQKLFPTSYELWKTEEVFRLRVGNSDLYIQFGIKDDLITNIYTWFPG